MQRMVPLNATDGPPPFRTVGHVRFRCVSGLVIASAAPPSARRSIPVTATIWRSGGHRRPAGSERISSSVSSPPCAGCGRGCCAGSDWPARASSRRFPRPDAGRAVITESAITLHRSRSMLSRPVNRARSNRPASCSASPLRTAAQLEELKLFAETKRSGSSPPTPKRPR